MKTSSPLYFNAADVLAAFSVADEPASHAMVSTRLSEIGVAPRTTALATLLSAREAIVRGVLRRWVDGLDTAVKRPSIAASPSTADLQFHQPAACFTNEERTASLRCSGLTSHFALAVPVK